MTCGPALRRKPYIAVVHVFGHLLLQGPWGGVDGFVLRGVPNGPPVVFRSLVSACYIRASFGLIDL